MADFKKLKDGQGNSYNVKDETARTNLASHTGNTSNPHSVTKAQVGLGNVDNTSDANKPISNAQATVNATIFDKANVDTTIPETPVDTHVPSTKLVNDKFVKHNTYDGTLSVKYADESDVATNLKAYSDDSGTLQENPFISQETGTNNNVEIVTTGNVCEIKSKNGNTISVNQIVPYNNITATKTQNGITITNNGDGTITISGTSTDVVDTGLTSSIPCINGHTYYNAISLKNDSYDLTSGNTIYIDGAIKTYSSGAVTKIATATSTGTFSIYLKVQTGITLNETIGVPVIDWTQWFNGNIPQDLLDNPSHFSWHYNGDLSYNTGSLVNANGRYLECGQGRNLWDEDFGLTFDNRYGSKNLIKVNPNTTYYFRESENQLFTICGFTEDGQNLGNINLTYAGITGHFTFIVPSNVEYIMFNLASGYGTTYNHDITISLYYTPEQGGEGYDKYYPYVAPKVIDTGNETLKAFDKKLPSGVIERNGGEKTLTADDVSEVSLAYTNVKYFSVAIPADMKGYGDYSEITIKNSKGYIPFRDNTLDSQNNIGCYSKGSTTTIWFGFVVGTTLAQAQASLDGMEIQYELADSAKYTEQGTPFSAYPDINDYSYMLWKDTDNNLVSVPQGASIFYPVNYAGTLDDLVAYVEGDVTNLAKKTDLTPYDDKDTQLLNAIGGTLRHMIEDVDFLNTDFVDLGTLNWNYSSGKFSTTYFRTLVTGANAKCISTLYERTEVSLADMSNMQMKFDSVGDLNVVNNSYTDATTFKNAMKGVLLAYEKASE